jgi:glutamate synthase (NADPH/NADH) small chain
MDDLYGFLRHQRREPGKESVRTRVRHWREYVRILPDEQAATQANRCIDCGTPWCHSYCPVHNLIPEWNQLVTDASWYRAYRQLDSTNNFPEFTGRLCPAPCEDACTLRLSGSPVTIKSIEQAIADRAWRRGWIVPRPSVRSRAERVAIVGSGPAGLACAQQLARVGYKITVYEKADRIGGLLRYGIPDFRLEKWILDRRLQQLEGEGVTFCPGVHVDSTKDVDTLRHRADAIVLACGCEQPRDVKVPGRQIQGIYFAMDYLSQQNHRSAGDVIEPEAAVVANNKDVVVIGGGDTGSDCVGTAIRQNANQVIQVQYHKQPPERADVLQYWPKPAPVMRSTDHDAEGCRRIWGWDTIQFEQQAGHVKSVKLQRLKWTRLINGSWDKQRLAGRFLSLPAQLVLIATGYSHPTRAGLIGNMGLALDTQGNVLSNDRDYQTNTTGVFACGDMRRGQSLIVWAIREGRQCAHAVDSWLSGHSELPTV